MSDQKFFAVVREDGPVGDIHILEVEHGTAEREINRRIGSARWAMVAAVDKRDAVKQFQAIEYRSPMRRDPDRHAPEFIAAL